MKKFEKTKKASRLILLIIFLSIIGLILVSLLPWISVAEDEAVKQNLHFNYEMMQKSNNKQIKNLTTYLNIINISFWILTILGIISFIGVTIYASNVNSRFGLILLASYCTSLILGVLIVFLNWTFIKNVEEISTISASTIIFTPIKYAYIPLLVGILLLITSIRYTWVILPYSIKELKSLPKDKKPTEKIDDNKKIEPEIINKKNISAIEKPSQEPKIDEERGEIEEWLTGEVQNIEKQVNKGKYLETQKQRELEKITPKEKPFLEGPLDIAEKKEEKPTQVKEEIFKDNFKKSIETPFINDDNKLNPFTSEKKVEKAKSFDDAGLAQSFDEALSAAIQKRHTGANLKDITNSNIKDVKNNSNLLYKQDNEEKQTLKTQNEEMLKSIDMITSQTIDKPAKKINVRCPQCKQITTIEKGETITKIKCPNCGKEGVIK